MVPADSFVRELVQRLRFFRSLDPLPADGRLLARPSGKEALARQLRDYLHQACHSLGLSTRIVPHQLRHTYASEMIRSGVGFAAVMKLLGHTSPEMTMLYVEVTLSDLQRELALARAKPRRLIPQPKARGASLRAGLAGVTDALLSAPACDGNVPPCAAGRPSAPLHRQALQSPYENHHPSPQTRHTMRMGSDWPVMPVLQELSARNRGRCL
jgi:hypothetical protein